MDAVSGSRTYARAASLIRRSTCSSKSRRPGRFRSPPISESTDDSAGDGGGRVDGECVDEGVDEGAGVGG